MFIWVFHPIQIMADIYETIDDMSSEQLNELLTAIKERLDELGEVRPEVTIGDVVQFEVRKATLTGVVEKTTDKRATVKLSTVEGQYTIDTRQIEIIDSAAVDEAQSTLDEY
tara:strand:- start:4470 stop:4805 length:336 start_codon:yes stop_codon:yes gene_type:complete